MRLLYIVSKGIYPPKSGGQLRIFEIIRHLAQKNETHLLIITEDHEHSLYLKELEKHKIHTKFFNAHQKKSLSKTISWINFILNPYGYINYGEIKQNIEMNIASINPDIIFYDDSGMGQFIGRSKKIEVLSTQNDNILVEWRMFLVEPRMTPSKIKRFFRWFVIRQAEIKIARKAKYIIAVSDLESQNYRKYNRFAKVFTIPNGIDIHQTSYNMELPTRPIVLFLGSMQYYPNLDAMEFFCSCIWPRVKSINPRIELFIVGVGSERLRTMKLFSEDPNINIIGTVDETEKWLHKARLFIAPIRIGGGTRIKLIEAMASGIPIVSTSVGAEGLEVKHMQHMIIQDQPSIFADSICQLIEDNNLSNQLRQESRKLAIDKYDWENITDEYEEILKFLRAKS